MNDKEFDGFLLKLEQELLNGQEVNAERLRAVVKTIDDLTMKQCSVKATKDVLEGNNVVRAIMAGYWFLRAVEIINVEFNTREKMKYVRGIEMKTNFNRDLMQLLSTIDDITQNKKRPERISELIEKFINVSERYNTNEIAEALSAFASIQNAVGEETAKKIVNAKNVKQSIDATYNNLLHLMKEANEKVTNELTKGFTLADASKSVEEVSDTVLHCGRTFKPIVDLIEGANNIDN